MYLSSPQQREEFKFALIDAFRTKSSLEQMLDYGLNKKLDVIAGGDNLNDIVYHLIDRAEAEDWVKDLIDAARQANSGNQKLKAIAQKIDSIERERLLDETKRNDFKGYELSEEQRKELLEAEKLLYQNRDELLRDCEELRREQELEKLEKLDKNFYDDFWG